uniref:Uncharacterized protein n=1 Tax=Anguilla anguilla TaxID=7936 RepID=A0A0E9T1L4_ANGAN
MGLCYFFYRLMLMSQKLSLPLRKM